MSPAAVRGRAAIALGRRLRHCAGVRCLGVRPNYSDYDRAEQALIRDAAKVYDPSAFYAELFDTLGKPTFPSYHTYKFAQDKIKQTALFQLAGIPHPPTRVFYGARQKARAAEFFNLPLISKPARGSALGRGIQLIRSPDQLADVLSQPGPAYLQQYLDIDRDIRVVVIGGRSVHAYWRVAPPGGFLTNLAAGAAVDLAPVPDAAIELAVRTARVCGWDDVGLDICEWQDKYYVLEANMKYGLDGFKAAGIDYHQLLSQMINDEEI